MKTFAVRILLVQMLESEQKAIYDGMDGAAISATTMPSLRDPIIFSVLGAVLGGTFVAICMALSVIGGILTLFGKTTTTPREEMLPAENNSNNRKIHWIWWGIGGIASVFVALLIIGIAATDSKKPPEPEQEQQEGQQLKPPAQAPADPLVVLENAPVDDLRADGELAEIFAIGSKNTDLQRERKLKSITGKIVQWRLPVYEVSLDGELYKVQKTRGQVLHCAFNYQA